MLDHFTRCTPKILHWRWRAAIFKTLYRNNGTYAKLGVHRPRTANKTRLDSARWYDRAGRLLPETFKTKRIYSTMDATISHWPDLTTTPLARLNPNCSKPTEAVRCTAQICSAWTTSLSGTSTLRLTPPSLP